MLVVFPEPLGPRNPVTVPEGAMRLTSSRATLSPKRFVTPLSSGIVTIPQT